MNYLVRAVVSLFLLLMVFPFFSTGALADFLGSSALPLKFLLEPVNLLLFGMGLTFACSRG